MTHNKKPRAPDKRTGAQGGVSCWQADTRMIAPLADLGDCTGLPDIAGGA